jgi:hypothetical protein
VRMHGGGMERENKEGEGTGIIPDFPYRRQREQGNCCR